LSNWTILIYANGNNELEPEIYESLINCEKVGSNDDVNVIMQIGRANRKIAEIMRPNEIFTEESEQWSGVRRYYISKSNSRLIQDLGKINMADPNNLYDFIKWGMESYPSEHYMVALGGHGISFVGNTTDLTQEVPYMMGTPEMCKAIDLIKNSMDVKIDILVLDMCYMNSIEIIYEFGKSKNNVVSNILTYIGEGPFKGLPYDTIIELIQNYSDFNNIEKILEDVINILNLDTIAFQINHENLESIKNRFSNLAYCYLINKDKYKLNPFHLFTKTNPNYPWYNIINELNESLASIIIHHKNNSNNKESLIKVICEELGSLINIYSKLAFIKNNYWINLLSNKKIGDKVNYYDNFDLKPMKLSKEGILYSILTTNPTLSIEKAESIINEIFFV